MHWFETSSSSPAFTPDAFPVVMIEDTDGTVFYAIPDVGDGVKAAIHHGGATMKISDMVRSIQPGDREPVARLARRFLPGLGEIRESVVCVYTNTPDRDFVVDELQPNSGVFVISACSGHGFKFASAIGEVVAGRCAGTAGVLDMSRFTVERFPAS